MTIKIVTVGNKPSSDLQTMINAYIKRLPRTVLVSWQYIKHGDGDAITSKHQESETIIKSISVKDFVVLLDESGKQITSEELSTTIFDKNTDLVFIIGGAYGVAQSVHTRANMVWSLSSLVFPHQLVRLILSEQLYRAYSISINHPYHHS